MIKKFALYLFSVLILMQFSITGAHAHRTQMSITTLEYLPAAAGMTIEITHKIHYHDAQEALLLSDQGATGMSVMELEAQARFALYTSQNFSLWHDNAKTDVTLIGAEVDGDYIYIYQEATLETAPQTITVDCYILRDVFGSFGNHVNIRRGRNVQTLIFQGDEGVKSAPLP
ncbi:hypothetical protein GCM10017044_18120 [Kordiimonas sediminis]|uniref:DUF1850 domain-containing protein n=1 Tax=Kordiimonas sediminis TaxID=1735581 RepID=A0A919ARQ3_9PROT|nr:DUF6702 family protein [Kordiimonas sediminis]GHF23926.1 hypothetical protein GCM10017044_18120 [Kordiimonas sediminis]